jgi:hypothetical protein
VMWDNRATMHRGRRYDNSQICDLHRTTVTDPEFTAIVLLPLWCRPKD